MHRKILPQLAAILAGAAQIVGCRDAVAPSPSSAISVTVQVSGAYPLDGFSLVIDNRAMTLLKSEPRLVVRSLSSGKHFIALAGLPPNCRSDGPGAVTVETASAELSTVVFRVTCVAYTGAIAVAVSVAGYNRQLWFEAQVDSASSRISVRGNATTVLLGSFAGGAHVVRLSAIPAFCTAPGGISTVVDVKTGGVVQDTAVAGFNFHCDPPEPDPYTAASIAFEREGNVMLMSETGGFPAALTEGARPAWSPDGNLIAFQRFKCDADEICDHDLWMMTRAGGSQRLLQAAPYFDDYDVAFSPNASRVAFIRIWLGPDQSYLAVSDLQGQSLTILSIWNPFGTPSWSPDGAQIVFSCQIDGSYAGLQLCLVNTGNGCESLFPARCNLPVQALATERGDHLDPAWSPDGLRVAFTLTCGGLPEICPDAVKTDDPYIAVIDLASRVVTRIVGGHDPAWSPDGSQLVFVGNSRSPGLQVYKFADRSVRQLTDNPHDTAPSWR